MKRRLLLPNVLVDLRYSDETAEETTEVMEANRGGDESNLIEVDNDNEDSIVPHVLREDSE